MNLLRQKPLQSFLGLLIIGTLLFGGFYFVKYQRAQKEIQTIQSDPATFQKAAAAQTAVLVAKVEKLIQLPKETPTVATITDATKLKSQIFFANAKNGDKVLIYTQAKKAVLYRESENRIIDVAPVNIGASEAQAKVALVNGTSVVGATTKVETQIITAFPGTSVVSKDDAVGTYDKTIVVALNDTAKTAAANLATTLKATVGNLPSGEAKPAGADIVIIIGSDLAK